MTRVAVTTPTGNVGRHVARALVRVGVRPLLLAREPGRIDDDLRDHVDVAEVDLADAAAVADAVREVDALSWVNPTELAGDPIAAHATYAASAVAALEAGVERVVFQSSVGAERRRGLGDIDGLGATEAALDAAVRDGGGRAPTVVHVRCGFFFTNLLMQLDELRAGTVPVLLPVDHPMAWVDPRDVGEVVAAALLAPMPPGRWVRAVLGPTDLTWAEATRVISAVCGCDVAAVRVPEEKVRRELAGVGLSPAAVDAVVTMSTGQLDGWSPEQERDATTTTPGTLAAWCASVLAPALSET